MAHVPILSYLLSEALSLLCLKWNPIATPISPFIISFSYLITDYQFHKDKDFYLVCSMEIHSPGPRIHSPGPGM